MTDAPVVRAARLYWRNRKVLESNRCAIKFVHGRKPIPGPSGPEGWSEGMGFAELTFEEFVPVGGSTTSRDIEYVLAQENILISLRIGGKWFAQKWAVVENEMTSDAETGICAGRYVCQGKLLNIVHNEIKDQ